MTHRAHKSPAQGTRQDTAELEARHLEELERLESILNELGHATQLFEKSAGTPYHALLVRLQGAALTTPLQMALTFYPVQPGEVAHVLLLQYFTELPLALDPAALTRIRALLPTLNNRTVLGHFGIAKGDTKLHYRYVQALPKAGPITAAAVADVFTLVGYTPALFLETITALAQDEITLEEAQSRIEGLYNSPQTGTGK